ncbi:hypothetical protein B0H19DRAFT_1055689 [Mycena capillaripes]|nr:hypothetical protein B0H19DRAFT_1055682 [Mycena capillaripes]KAJ6593037.1 hypothetical protein B0H19DRAFT_1055689 [Mycena capillaripes]
MSSARHPQRRHRTPTRNLQSSRMSSHHDHGILQTPPYPFTFRLAPRAFVASAAQTNDEVRAMISDPATPPGSQTSIISESYPAVLLMELNPNQFSLAQHDALSSIIADARQRLLIDRAALHDQMKTSEEMRNSLIQLKEDIAQRFAALSITIEANHLFLEMSAENNRAALKEIDRLEAMLGSIVRETRVTETGLSGPQLHSSMQRDSPPAQRVGETYEELARRVFASANHRRLSAQRRSEPYEEFARRAFA